MHPGATKVQLVAVPFDAMRTAPQTLQGLDDEGVNTPSAGLHGRTDSRRAPANDDETAHAAHSTVTLLARFRG
jgi:hypothetical protein